MGISVTYNEMDGWPKEMATLEGFAAERKLICDWEDRTALMVEIMSVGYNVYPYNDSGATVTHIPRCEGLRKGKQSQGTQTHMASYEKAVLTVNYSTYGIATGKTQEGLLISEWTDTWAEFRTLNPYKFKWGDDKLLGPSEALSKIEPGLDYILMYHALPFVPAAAASFPGTVNNATVTPYLLQVPFAAETLQYMGAQIKHRITTRGGTAFQVRYRFRYKPNFSNGVANGWNYYWNAANAAYEKVYDVTSGNQVKNYIPVTFRF